MSLIFIKGGCYSTTTNSPDEKKKKLKEAEGEKELSKSNNKVSAKANTEGKNQSYLLFFPPI
jgi:hypothetical protein